MRAEPGRYDCQQCAWAEHWGALWDVNREAWRLYGALAARTVRTLDLQGWALTQHTAEWTASEILDGLARLDLILDVLQPETAHG